MRTISEHFATVADPRVERTKLHPLINVITIALCGMISGADDWVAIEVYGRAKQSFLNTFLDLTHGIPSHDTFRRVFGCLDPEQFQAQFLSWVQGIEQVTQGEVVAIDGKHLRGSRQAAKGAIHLMRAWATQNRLVLGQCKVDAKSRPGGTRITAIPELLELLHLKGCIVTIDTMGCQQAISAAIIEQEADYLLALKGNQLELHRAVDDYFAALLDAKPTLICVSADGGCRPWPP